MPNKALSTQNPVLDNSTISKDIVKDLLAQGLQDHADADGTALTDPKAPRDNKTAPLVLTSWPDQGLLYPHIVVQEANIESTNFDNRHELWEHDVQVLFTITAEQDTQKFMLKDAVRGWILSSQQGELKDGGFSDGQINSTSNADWENDPEATSVQITASGTVYSS